LLQGGRKIKINLPGKQRAYTTKIDKAEILVHNAIVYVIAFASINQLLSAGAGLFSTLIQNNVVIILYVVALFILILGIPVILKALSIRDLVLFFSFFSVLTISFAISSNPSYLFSNLRTIILRCIPLFLLFRSITTTELLLKKLRTAAYIILMAQILTVLFFRDSWGNNYSMYSGYEALNSAMILLVIFFYRWKWVDFMGFLMACMVVILSGTRGPLLIVSVVLISFIARSLWVNRSSPIILILALFFISVIPIFILSFDYFLSGIYDKMQMSILGSRSINLLFDGRMFDSHGRLRRYVAALQYSSQHILIGTGFFNDRIVLGEVLNTISPTYAHNFVLEVLMQFGLIPGILFLVSFVKLIAFRIKKFNSEADRSTLILLMVTGIFPLLFSFSYLQWPMFYGLIGYVLNNKIWKRLSR